MFVRSRRREFVQKKKSFARAFRVSERASSARQAAHNKSRGACCDRALGFKLAAREVSVFWLRKNRKRCTQSSMSDRAVRRGCLCAIVGPGPVAGREAPTRLPRLSGPPSLTSLPSFRHASACPFGAWCCVGGGTLWVQKVRRRCSAAAAAVGAAMTVPDCGRSSAAAFERSLEEGFSSDVLRARMMPALRPSEAGHGGAVRFSTSWAHSAPRRRGGKRLVALSECEECVSRAVAALLPRAAARRCCSFWCFQPACSQ